MNSDLDRFTSYDNAVLARYHPRVSSGADGSKQMRDATRQAVQRWTGNFAFHIRSQGAGTTGTTGTPVYQRMTREGRLSVLL